MQIEIGKFYKTRGGKKLMCFTVLKVVLQHKNI